MQKIFLFITLILISGYMMAQSIPPGSCGLLYTYDATGNRIKQEYFCNNTTSPVQMRTTTTASQQPESNLETGFVTVDVLYPNPTTGRFTIRFAEELKGVQIVLTDVNGRTIQQIKGNGYTVGFDIANQPAGVYYVVIRNGKNSIIQKVVRQ